jgi:hypothetical protein
MFEDEDTQDQSSYILFNEHTVTELTDVTLETADLHVYSGGTQPECSLFFSIFPRPFLVTFIPPHHAQPLHVLLETNPLADKISSITIKS